MLISRVREIAIFIITASKSGPKLVATPDMHSDMVQNTAEGLTRINICSTKRYEDTRSRVARPLLAQGLSPCSGQRPDCYFSFIAGMEFSANIVTVLRAKIAVRLPETIV